jgi:hypothetical protein
MLLYSRIGFLSPSGRYTSRRKIITCPHALWMLLLYIGHGCSFKIVGAMCGYSKEAARFHILKMKGIFVDNIISSVIKWPTSEQEVAEIKQDFLVRSHIMDIVGAVNGTRIPILIPEDCHMDYLNRKSFHSVVFQGIAVGTTLKFIDFYGGWLGSVHDAAVWTSSSIYKKFKCS